MLKAKISALGCYTPPGVLTNDDLTRMVDTSNEWILTRTGIAQRHIAAPDQATSDLAVEAARLALEQRGITADEVDSIIVCTVTPDMAFPATACLVQDRLQASQAWGFDLEAACSGFVFGLTTAAHLVQTGKHRRVLLIGADTMSRILDFEDRATCVLFGDGAGAVIVEPTEDGEQGLIGYKQWIDGSGAVSLYMPAGGSRKPASAATVAAREHSVHQAGQQVYKYAVSNMFEVCQSLLQEHGLTARDVQCMIPHQANRRIISAVAERLEIPCDRVIINIDQYGNTTAATIPLATRDAIETGRLKKGDLVLFASVGAGYTVGASLWRWAY